MILLHINMTKGIIVLRLRNPSDAKSNKPSQDENPYETRSKGAQKSIVKREHRT